MDTKKIQLQGTGKKKAGLNVTQTILTAGGAVAVGAAAGAAMTSGAQEAEIPVNPHVGNEETAEEQGLNEEPTAQQQTGSEQEATTGNAESGSQDITQPQPTDGGTQPGGQPSQPADNGQTPPSQPEHGTGTPEEIAENIIGTAKIDENDIDVPDVIAVDGFTTVFNEEGFEVQAAMVHTPDGGQFLLADADGDGVFEGVYDESGNLVAEAHANITQSDLETMLDQSGGYLALTEADDIMPSSDPTLDIVDTETGEHVDIAQYTPEANAASGEDYPEPAPEEDVDDILAQLLDGDDETTEENIYDTDEHDMAEDDVAEDDVDADDSPLYG